LLISGWVQCPTQIHSVAILLDLLESLSIAQLFLVTIIGGVVAGALVLVTVRVTVHVLGIAPTQSLPIRDALIGSLSTMFALMVAFSAAGIWSDTVQARAAVQREANSIENVFAIAWSFPNEFREHVHSEILRYARQVIESDWPAMRRRAEVNETLLDRSNSPLVALITRTSEESSSGRSHPLSRALIDQIADLRAARLQREMIARGGVSQAQWLAMILIALGAMTMIAVAHNHESGLQITTLAVYQITTLAVYAVGVSSAFFVVLAHDRPFVGYLAVEPIPIEQVIERIERSFGPLIALAGE
jgi:hypothetical protein